MTRPLIRVKILGRNPTPAVSRCPAAKPHSRSRCPHSPWAAATSVSPPPAPPWAGSLQPAVPPGSLGKDAVLAPAASHRLTWGGQNSPAGPSGVQHLHSSSRSQPHWGFQSNRGRARSTLSLEMGKKTKDTGVVGPQCVGVYLSPSGR